MAGNTFWLAESVGKNRTGFHFIANGFDVAAQFFIRQPIGQQVETFQNRQTRSNQRHKLLVEDQELFEIDGLSCGQRRRPNGFPNLWREQNKPG